MRKRLLRKVRISGAIVFDTAFHIGSGTVGELATDMGVLLDPAGAPVLPGSSLKGNFRATAEKLAEYLGLTACCLDRSLSGVDCVSDEAYRKGVQDAFRAIKGEAGQLEWLGKHTCDVCRFFGSPMQASRIFFADGRLREWAGNVGVRDGVCLDRDSGTARAGLKYDFEAVPAGASFEIVIDLENPSEGELALVGAVLTEWEDGFRIGGFTSRGLGGARFEKRVVEQVDYSNTEHLQSYLLKRQMIRSDDLLETALRKILAAQGASHA
jgi:CRISPR-associated RAMP protein (TIGR02581 family)